MIVVDANLLVVLVSGDVRKPLVRQKFAEWIQQDQEIYAPELARYEFSNGLTRLIVGAAFDINKVQAAWEEISLLSINYQPVSNAAKIVGIAMKLKRQNAYDAAYIALAESLGAELWTMDGPLYRNASGLGYPVKLLT
ncbi:MAG: type II toxin-antitoxin system VapC family toxin [Blastocatellales bacterium]